MTGLDDEGDGETPMRERVLAAVRRFPGIHFRGIVRELDTSTALVRYHIQHLLEQEDIRQVQVGGYTRYFPIEEFRELTDEEKKMLNVLRQEKPLEIVLELLEFGSMQHKDLHELIGGSKGTLTYHLNKLVDAGVVRRVRSGEERGFHLEDPEHVRELLTRYEPESDILDHVHDLWEDLFGGHRR